MVDLYKKGLISEWGIKKFNLDDLYVRFFRLAERKIGQHKGVVCYISNFSYLSDPSFVVMRQRFLSEFDRLWFDSLNGDSRETGKLTPEGKPDPSVFSTQYNREGIRVGTAIGLMVRKEKRETKPTVHFRQFWGVNKRGELLESLQDGSTGPSYLPANPTQNNRFSFRTQNASAHYDAWPKLSDLWVVASNGLMEKRGGSLMGIDRKTLEDRMKSYYNVSVSWESYQFLGTALSKNAARFNAKGTRSKVQAQEKY